MHKVFNTDCLNFLKINNLSKFDLTFLDPPFNQSKSYRFHDDNMTPKEYWSWMEEVCRAIYDSSTDGSAIYFMQREKNVSHVVSTLQSGGWQYQNLIIWKKKTSAVPNRRRFGLHYQIIVFATKGKKPRVFNKLRIDPPLLETEKYRRPRGMYVTDVWDDIRELTSGYFAGDEPIRTESGTRFHKQQSPIQLLARIILSSTNPGDTVFDPFAGTGTTLVVAEQLKRNSIGIEIDESNCAVIEDRLRKKRDSDRIDKIRGMYSHTEELDRIWPITMETEKRTIYSEKTGQLPLNRSWD